MTKLPILKNINKIEDCQRECVETVTQVESYSKLAEKRLTVTESKIRKLEEKNDKLKKVVVKQQSHIGYQEKSMRLRNVVIGGLDESDPLALN